MKKSNLLPEELKRGDVLLVRVRKIHNFKPDQTRDQKNFKVQIELAEHIDNPYRPLNPTSIFNEGDNRFVGFRPRRGFTSFEPSGWQKYFGNLVPIEDIEKLEFSSTTSNDVKSSDEQKEGVHFYYLGVLNPSIQLAGHTLELHVKVIETLVPTNDQAPVKLNPGTDEAQTVNGKPIYQLGQTSFNKGESEFLVSDQMIESMKSGRLPKNREAIQMYNQMLLDLSSIKLETVTADQRVNNLEQELIGK